MQTGQKLGAYEIIAKLGAGAWARSIARATPSSVVRRADAGDGKRLLAAMPVETNAPPRPLTVVMN